MDRARFFGPASLALALVILATPGGRSDTLISPTSSEQPSDDFGCVFYPLDDLKGDADLGKWIAETIPDVIAPGTWRGQSVGTTYKVEGFIRYCPPKNLLVVYHSPAIQAKVGAFLENAKKSLPAGNDRSRVAAKAPVGESAVVPADFRVRVSSPDRRPSSLAEQGLSYPVPTAPTRPKHLFHFIIRYEGEGIVDDNVVRAIKTQYPTKKKEKADKDPLVGTSAPTAGSASGTPVISSGRPDGPGSTSLPPLPSATAPSTADKKQDKKADKEDKEER